MSPPNEHPHQLSRQLLLVGGGGHALVVAEAAQLSDWTLIGVYDDAEQPCVCEKFGIPRLGTMSGLLAGGRPIPGAWHLALGNLQVRARLIERLMGEAAAIVHPRAFVSPSATVAPGVFVGAMAVVHTAASLGPHAIINTGAIVEHECRVGANTHLAPGTVLGGNVRVGDHTLVGLGARVVPGVAVGDGCVVGAGAVVVRDVPADTRVRGVPARAF
jgi:sugar O-acyltransferase (sialic acid O-acetyltransferase NeuD family)